MSHKEGITSGYFRVNGGFENQAPFDIHAGVTNFSGEVKTARITINSLIAGNGKIPVGGTPVIISIPPRGFNKYVALNLPTGDYEVNFRLSDDDDLHPGVSVLDDEGDVVLVITASDFVDQRDDD